MRIYLQIPAMDDKAPRYYHLLLQQDLLEGWTLIREWGQQGAKGRVRREHFATQREAAAALEQARDDQVKRGYRVVFIEGYKGG